MGMNRTAELFYEFAGFRLDVSKRLLVRQGQPVDLAPKVFDTLLVFVQNAGRILGKDELMKALWPESHVEEGNLTQNIFVLRNTLGDDRSGNSLIQNIPRRGYRFVASVKVLTASAPETGAADPAQSSLIADYWNRHSPFRSLQTFEPEDAWLFFGRDPEINKLLERLACSPVLVVIGNSGCGKSSLIRAGLVPALHAGRFSCEGKEIDSWRTAVIRPSDAPFDYLAEIVASQLAPESSLRERADFIAECRERARLDQNALRNAITALVGAFKPREKADQTHVLLVADQFEEIFTLTSNNEIRESYIEALLKASQPGGALPIHVVLILRADFYAQCLEHEGLSQCLQTNLYNVPRMNREHLRESIERRLELAAAQAEAGLIESLLEEVGAEPGNLALLEHALGQLWTRCGGFGCMLSNQAYSEIGRLRGALGRHADEVYSSLGSDHSKALAQKIFLELVHLGEEDPAGSHNDTRQCVSKAELLELGNETEIEQLLARLVSSRLISTGGSEEATFVEVSHEALIREWPTLREWISLHRESLRLERRLRQAAQEWEDLKREPGALLQGARLAQAEEWLAKSPKAPRYLHEFLQASIRAREEAEHKELTLQKRELLLQKRAAARLRWSSFALALLLIAAAGVALYIYRLQLRQKSQMLAAQADELRERDQGQALDLAIRSLAIAKTDASRLAIAKAFPEMIATLSHGGPVERAVFSPDGTQILTASYDNKAYVWDSLDGHLIITLQGHTDKVEHADYSPDGKTIATASYDGTGRLWNSTNGHPLAELRGHKGRVLWTAFSPDGRLVVTAGYDHTARIWSTLDGRPLAVLPHDNVVTEAVFSPDGKLIVTSSWDRTARLWSSTDGRLVKKLLGHTNELLHAEFSPDGRRILTTSRDQTARVWDAGNGNLLMTLQHQALVAMAKFSSDGSLIVSASEDTTAKLWRSSDGRLLTTLRHDGTVQFANFSPDGRHIITSSFDRTARLWNVSNGKLVGVFQGHNGPVIHSAFAPDGKRVVTASNDGKARVWNLSSVRLLFSLQGHADRIYRVAASPNGELVTTASGDGTVRIWNVSSGQLLHTLKGHTDRVHSVMFSPDGRRIITASADGTARSWSTAEGSSLMVFRGHTDRVFYAAFSPDGERVVTASADQTARTWNSQDGRLQSVLRGHHGAVWCARFSPDGQRIVTASSDYTAALWSAVDGRLLTALPGHTSDVIDVEHSPDGQRIVTASSDSTARVWNSDDGRLIAILQGHTASVVSAEFSPDGRRIVTASRDKTARTWSSADGRSLVVFRGHTAEVHHATFSKDGQRILTASSDATARVWDSGSGRPLAILQGHTDELRDATFAQDGRRTVTASFDHTARVWSVVTLSDVEELLAK